MPWARATAVTASGSVSIKSLAGWQFTENAGTPAAARVLLRDGGASGAIIHDIRLAASESVGDSFNIPVLLTGNLYVDVTSGTVRGAVFGS